MSEIPKGICQCGCGQHTMPARVNDRSKGWVKGEPLRYVDGHSAKHASALRSRAPVGTKFVTSHGYIEVSLGGGRCQYEHIIKAEKVLGRPLRNFGVGHADNEVVHHIDGNKQNNDNSNLLLCTHSYHTALHHRLEQSPAWPEFPKIVRFQGRRKTA